jgi:hypothetical protein|tara:strand:+ start:254 stop:496 length:243 start_codon:yes stop_codon:yes gene_type:complete
MKVIMLIMFLCSGTSNTCLPYQWPETFNDPYECMLKGYEEAFNKTEEIGRTDVNQDAIYIKFRCLEKAIIIPKEKPKVST